MSEQAIEQEIQEKGKTDPRITPQHIDSVIHSEHYFTAAEAIAAIDGESKYVLPKPLQSLAFCVLVLRNGFTVTGESACASPENFDEAIGRKIALQNAREKIYALEGYLLKQKLHDA